MDQTADIPDADHIHPIYPGEQSSTISHGSIEHRSLTHDLSGHQPRRNSTGNSPPAAHGYRCRWRGCSTDAADMVALFNHLHDHARGSMSGPCQWDECGKKAHGGRRCRFMEWHITEHLPRKSFRCFMVGCQKAFDTPAELNVHVSRHQQPKKNFAVSSSDRLDEDDWNEKRIREIPVQKNNYAGGVEQLQRSLEARHVLALLGVCYVALKNEYFVTVHGLPTGNCRESGDAFEQVYQLRFPYAPHWMREMLVRFRLKQTESRLAIISWKLPLSNPIFLAPLRLFVKDVEKNLAV